MKEVLRTRCGIARGIWLLVLDVLKPHQPMVTELPQGAPMSINELSVAIGKDRTTIKALESEGLVEGD
ncbi:hypothetical protein RBI02_02580 [Thermococcus waiotapuensis]|uniref:Uncharacterized protein n=1 Tax=Thermococcus waiotapuensis TaxID=90909 RepID=A0AAE4SY77_9EURY|nr:hypothetical protein [Thermococcus waiotapuensis]MDV3103434.1 hypothetical protein [Thermococcus waiotapuensis]